MTPLALALALLADPLWHGGGGAQALALATEVRAAEERWALPAGILAAVVLIESRGKRRIISKRRRCGGRDAGVAQIHEHDDTRLRRLLTLSVNLDEGARILARSRAVCRARGRRWPACHRSPWALYNAGSARWPAAVARTHRRLLEAVTYGPRS